MIKPSQPILLENDNNPRVLPVLLLQRLDIRRINLDSTRCPKCDNGIETDNHVFVDYSVAIGVWNSISSWWGVNDCPKDLQNLIRWADSVDINIKAKACFNAVIQTTTWILWRYKNMICLQLKPPRKDTLVEEIMILSHCSILYRNRKFNPSWIDWISNPTDACSKVCSHLGLRFKSPGADLYLNKLTPSVGPKIFSTKEIDGNPVEGGCPEGADDREETNPPLTKEQIEDLREAFAARFSVRRIRFKEPHEITKIIRRPTIKSPELAKRFSNKVSTTVNERMERLDGFVRSEEAYASIELPKGEMGESHRKTSFPSNGRGIRLLQNTRLMESRRDDYQNRYRGRDTYHANRPMDDRALYPPPRGEYNRRVAPDIFKEPLIVEAQVEGYLVRRVYVDKGSSVEVMFEHCFENLNPKIKAGLRETQTDLVGFIKEVSKPLGKIELEVCFGNKGPCRRTSMKFIMVRAPSPYNIILERPGLKTLQAIPSTIYAMMKFPTPKGVATLVTRTLIIAECRRLEKKQMVEEESHEEKGEVAVMEEVSVNPSFSDQLVTIGRWLSEAGKDQLKCLLKDNMEVFVWEPSDMTGVPRRIIKHALNVNPSLGPVCEKLRTFSMEKSKVVTNEVAEWVKAGRNLEAYVDDMVIKSRDEKMLLADISETFDNLKKINMKLNPKKCSFRVEEGKFIGYMKLITDLPSLTPPQEKKNLYAYLAVSAEAISAVLLTDRKGRQCYIQYVSKTLNEAKRNYAPMEKLALALIHMTRRLRRYFEAHSIKVIIDQPIKSIGGFPLRSTGMGKGRIVLLNAEGLVLLGPSGIEYAYALRLTFSSTKNEAEYEAFLAGLRIARQMNISNIKVKVDSKLVASRINGTNEASKDNMIKYLAKAKDYASGFKSFSIKIYTPLKMRRNENMYGALLHNTTAQDTRERPLIKSFEK
nr:reverse transcriptase domain-containing protein [Tanacetum cinerariifolium]